MTTLREAQQYRDWLVSTEAFVIVAAEEADTFGGFAARIGSRTYAPRFQFDPSGGLLRNAAVVKEILVALAQPDDGGWSAMFWLFQPHALLAGATPAESLAENSEAVVDAAVRDTQTVRREDT